MNSQHSLEPWTAEEVDCHIEIMNAKGLVFSTRYTSRSEVTERRRIDSLSRAVACVNALAGIADPAVAIKAARELVQSSDCLNDVLNPCRLSNVVGKHWGGGKACLVCTAWLALNCQPMGGLK